MHTKYYGFGFIFAALVISAAFGFGTWGFVIMLALSFACFIIDGIKVDHKNNGHIK